MSLLKLNLIAACDAKMGIGAKNDLPWRLRKEMAYFNRMTNGTKDPGSTTGRNVVLMGRLTYDSIPEKFRPLKGRINIVLSRNDIIKEPTDNLMGFKTWDEAMNYLAEMKDQNTIDDVWVTGGSHIYKMAMESPLCHRIYLTRIQKEFEECDVFFPPFDETKFQLVNDPLVPEEEQKEGDIRYRFEVYEKISDAQESSVMLKNTGH